MIEIDKFTVPSTASIAAAMQVIDLNGGHVALVLDGDKRLVGTVSDGDIRRALLAGRSMGDLVTTIANHHPITVREDATQEEALAVMRRHILRDIPVVDAEGHILGLRTLEQLTQREVRQNPVVIMAGGLGARLRPLTENCPKPMLKVGGRPLLETTLERLYALGFRNVYVAVNYMAEVITGYFGDGTALGLKLKYLNEKTAMGTAGALSLLPEWPDTDIIVMNGDILTMADYPAMLDFHAEHGAAATMAVREFETQVPYGVVVADGFEIKEFQEKPTYRHLVNAGLYVLAPRMRDLIVADQRMDMPELFQAAAARGWRTMPHLVREYWIDIGHVADYERARTQYSLIFGGKS